MDGREDAGRGDISHPAGTAQSRPSMHAQEGEESRGATSPSSLFLAAVVPQARHMGSEHGISCVAHGRPIFTSSSHLHHLSFSFQLHLLLPPPSLHPPRGGKVPCWLAGNLRCPSTTAVLAADPRKKKKQCRTEGKDKRWPIKHLSTTTSSLPYFFFLLTTFLRSHDSCSCNKVPSSCLIRKQRATVENKF